MQKIAFFIEWKIKITASAQLLCAPRGGFLNIIPIGILTYAGMKTSFHTDASPTETGFHVGIGRNGDWNNL